MTNHEDTDPTPIAQVPLGYEPIAEFADDLAEARRFHRTHGHLQATLLVIEGNGNISIWICRARLWPPQPIRPLC